MRRPSRAQSGKLGLGASVIACALFACTTPGSPSGAPQSIAITPATDSIPVQGNLQFRLLATYSGQSTLDVTARAVWVTDTESIAAFLNGSPGLVTGVAAGETTVRASFEGKSASAPLTVIGSENNNGTDAGPVDPGLLGIGVSPNNWHITVGSNYQLTATGAFDDGSTYVLESNVAWSSSDTSTATVDPATGVVTGVSAGSATITAAVGSISGSATVDIVAAGPTLVAVSISPRPSTLAVGQTQQLTVTATYSDNSTGDVTSTVQWSTSPAGLATVSTSGLLTAVAAGDVEISAAIGLDSDDFPLTVTMPGSPPTLTSISVSPGSVTLVPTGTQQLSVTGQYSDGSNAAIAASSVTFTPADTSIVTVSAAGLVTAVAMGTTTIGAAYQSKTATVHVTVGAALGCTPVINEVQPGQKGAATNEFIELYNPCGASVDTTNWAVYYHSTTGSSDIQLVKLTKAMPSLGFVVLGYKDSSGSGFTGTADYTYKAVSIASGSGGIRLTQASSGTGPGTTVDSMSYGTQSASSQNPYTSGSPAPYAGDATPAKSVARKMDGVSTQNNSADFAETSTPTPGAANVITP